ncbi:MAG: hypothetical protein H0U15_13840 [Geodermatophilaceae bacterium]|jgi:hypothetical protein|nr:hypothetical protein [Geodermatophilaceae bacterium]
MGFFVILSPLVGVVVDASAVYLRRQGCNSLADGAALAAADASRPSRCTTEDSMGTAKWTPESRRRYAEQTSTRGPPISGPPARCLCGR